MFRVLWPWSRACNGIAVEAIPLGPLEGAINTVAIAATGRTTEQLAGDLVTNAIQDVNIQLPEGQKVPDKNLKV